MLQYIRDCCKVNNTMQANYYCRYVLTKEERILQNHCLNEIFWVSLAKVFSTNLYHLIEFSLQSVLT